MTKITLGTVLLNFNKEGKNKRKIKLTHKVLRCALLLYSYDPTFKMDSEKKDRKIIAISFMVDGVSLHSA